MVRRVFWRTNILTNIVPSQDVLTHQNIEEVMEFNFGRPEEIYKELLTDLTRIKKEHRAVVTDISEATWN